jgi:hypothetical protein
MKKIALFAGLFLILFSYSTAFGEQVRITIESYAKPSLGVRSTIVETIDPYDPNDPADQLAMAHEAMSFAWSSDGWDFESEGFYEGSSAGCNGTLWGLGVDGITYLTDPTYYEALLGGYVLNSEALWAINNTPTNQATGLVFHTDALCSQGSHDFCGAANNYGQIAQVMAGVCMQCGVPDWGRFSVELLQEPIQATVDLDPDIFVVHVKNRKPREPKRAFLRAYIELPEGVSVEDVDTSTIILSKDDSILAEAEFDKIVDKILVVRFPLDLTNVSVILGVDIVRVMEWYKKIRAIATAAPVYPIDCIELTISGDFVDDQGSFNGKDAVRMMLKK